MFGITSGAVDCNVLALGYRCEKVSGVMNAVFAPRSVCRSVQAGRVGRVIRAALPSGLRSLGTKGRERVFPWGLRAGGGPVAGRGRAWGGVGVGRRAALGWQALHARCRYTPGRTHTRPSPAPARHYQSAGRIAPCKLNPFAQDTLSARPGL